MMGAVDEIEKGNDGVLPGPERLQTVPRTGASIDRWLEKVLMINGTPPNNQSPDKMVV